LDELGVELFGHVHFVAVVRGEEFNLAAIDATLCVQPLHVAFNALGVGGAHVGRGAGQVEDGANLDGAGFGRGFTLLTARHQSQRKHGQQEPEYLTPHLFTSFVRNLTGSTSRSFT